MVDVIALWYEYFLAHARSLLADPNLPWILLGIALGCVFACWVYAFYLYRTVRRLGVDVMGKKKKKQLTKHERMLLEDAVTEALEDAVYNNSMTRKRAKYWYARLATDYGLFGLIPRRKKKVSNGQATYLKDQIKKRLSNGIFKPVSIPGTPPWEDERPTSKSKMRAFLASRK